MYSRIAQAAVGACPSGTCSGPPPLPVQAQALGPPSSLCWWFLPKREAWKPKTHVKAQRLRLRQKQTWKPKECVEA